MLRLGYVIALSLALAAPAAAHGEYDWINKGGYRGVNGDHCCGKDDCYKLEASEVQQQKDGIHVPAYGVTVPYKEVQRSEDEHYWICRTSSRMRCFFAPHQGF